MKATIRLYKKRYSAAMEVKPKRYKAGVVFKLMPPQENGFDYTFDFELS